ncbi:MAG: hypothetical protein PF961_21075 [Planctomycetota bacterium]|jgi:Tfp pilus assembly protein PilV|nr:hypothetical protein [Planctomycetota bacterium]
MRRTSGLWLIEIAVSVLLLTTIAGVSVIQLHTARRAEASVGRGPELELVQNALLRFRLGHTVEAEAGWSVSTSPVDDGLERLDITCPSGHFSTLRRVTP